MEDIIVSNNNPTDLDDALAFIGSIVSTVDSEADHIDTISLHWLNDDCLRLIFLFITRKTLQSVHVQSVCKRWFILINSMLFCRPKLSLFTAAEHHKDGKYYTDENVVQIGHSVFNFVQALYFTEEIVSELILSKIVKPYNFSATIEVIKVVPSVSTIKIRYKAIVQLCPNLNEFSIDRCLGLPKIDPEDEGVEPFLFPSNLNELSITNKWIKEPGLSHILQSSCTTLQKLVLSRAGLFSGLSIVEHLHGCKMKVLDLSGCCRLKPSIFPFIFKAYHDTLEELHFPTSIMTLPVPDGVIMEKLKCVTMYEVCQNGGIREHDDNVVWSLFRAMVNVENLTILTDNRPLYRRFEPCQYFDYMSKLLTLKKLKNITLPLEPMRYSMFGSHSFIRELKELGVKVRIDSNY